MSKGSVGGLLRRAKAIGLTWAVACELYRGFRKKVDATMRQVHRAGEKVFVDYSGTKLSYFDRELGERVEVEFFVAVLGASNYTYAEATRSQKVADFCASTARAFEYFGGVPEIVVPDQLRAAVKGPEKLELASAFILASPIPTKSPR